MTIALRRHQPHAAAPSGLLALAREVTGFLDGEIGPALPGWHQAFGDNQLALGDLHAALAERFAEAGPPFWAVRMWTNLLWQPAYLAVCGVHFGGVAPALDGLSQQRKGVDIAACRHDGRPHLAEGHERELIAPAGAALRAFADSVLAEINRFEKLKRLPALRLLTDRMLGCMLMLQRKRPDLTASDIRAICDAWLSAMGLVGQGDLESLMLADGREVLLIARKGCCLDYLAFPGTYCASCPKQDDDVRKTRQREDALAMLAG